MGDYEAQKAIISHPQILVVCVPSGGVMVLGLSSDKLNSSQFQRTLLKLKIDTAEGPNSVQNSGLFWRSKCFDIYTHPEVLLYIPNTRTGNDSFDFITLPQYPFDAHFEDKATTTDR